LATGNRHAVQRRIGAWVLWWIVCWWGFMLLAGDWNRIEWIGAACVATVGATLAELVRASGRVSPGISGPMLRKAPRALAQVPVDFWILTRALLTGQREPGRYIAREFAPRGRAGRAWTVLVAGWSPNAYVVDIDEERGTVLLHDLVPNRSSEEPA
jgi:hypothetical protein